MYGLYHASRSLKAAAFPPAPLGRSSSRHDGVTARESRAAGPEIAWIDVAADGRRAALGVTALTGVTRAHPHPLHTELGKMASRGELAGRIVPAVSAARFYWFAPSPDGGLRALAVEEVAFSALIDRFHRDRHVTAAEQRTLFQLVAGAGPREAAAADGVSFETKRAQVKSLCAKLGCSGQTDLVRLSMGLLVHLLHLTALED